MKKFLTKKNIIIGVSLLLGVSCIATSCLIYINKDINKNLSIKLNGKNNITIEYKSKYKDEGAKAYYKKIDLTKNIKTTNNLDVNKLGTYTYTYKIKYRNHTKKITRKIIVVDKTKPEITLNGDSELTLNVGSTYEEKGAQAIDNYDNDIIDKIEITGEVDTSKAGEYTINYKVVDSNGNENSITRKIIVTEQISNQYVDTNNYYTGVVGTTSNGYTIEQVNGVYYINGILIANKTYSLPSTYNPGNLLSVFQDNFNRMQTDALNEGISLNIISGFRSYSTQRSIYNNYAAKDGQAGADRYSARPGYSEHQSGLAADINSLQQSFEYTPEGQWLNNNCYKYGFIIRYVKEKEHITGYMFEPWHIRYVGEELATKLYNNGNWITLEEYFGITSNYN